MIPLTRGDAPEVLRRKALSWTDELLEARRTDPSAKARSDRYGHEDVRAALRGISARKCFYCESAVTPRVDEEVDHYVEQADRADLAYAWENLYLSCHGCNHGKPTNERIAVRDCVDPCDATTDPDDHLDFVDEQITEHPGSARGRQTIKKYRLDRPELDAARLRYLKMLHVEFRAIVGEMRRAGAERVSASQRLRLRVFCNPSRPFSAMMRQQVDAVLAALDGR